MTEDAVQREVLEREIDALLTRNRYLPGGFVYDESPHLTLSMSTSDPNDPAEAESVDMNQLVWNPKFRQGNRRFLTKRLWGSANEAPYFHHGMYTTLRQAVLAHSGEAIDPRRKFQKLAEYDQDALIEFLKSLQVLPPGTKDLVVDENFRRKAWSHE